MLQRVEWTTRCVPALLAAAVGLGIIFVSAGAGAADKDSNGPSTHCDNKRSWVSYGWCPDTGRKQDGAQESRNPGRQSEPQNEGESEAPSGGDSAPSVDGE